CASTPASNRPTTPSTPARPRVATASSAPLERPESSLRPLDYACIVGGPAVLRTERLILRPWRDADLPPFAALNADPRVREHFPSCLTHAESDASAARIRANFEAHGHGLWAAEVVGGAP